MPAVLVAPASPDPDDEDPALEYVTEDQLRDSGIDPDLVPVLCPRATELCALDGSRCWARVDIARLFDAEGDVPW
jgi:hypothetical protein